MRKLLVKAILVNILIVTGCGEDEEAPFDFSTCRLLTVLATGQSTYMDELTYNDSGEKISFQRSPTGGGETYEYTAGHITKITGDFFRDFDLYLPCVRDVTYDGDKILKIIVKTPGGDLLFTDDYEWEEDALMINRTDASSDLILTHAYEFADQDIVKETYTQYDGPTLLSETVYEYFLYDEGYNPEYLLEYPFPASLHNYNKLVITYSDFFGEEPFYEVITFDYTVTLNDSKAVENRERVRHDGITLHRTYSYENCN